MRQSFKTIVLVFILCITLIPLSVGSQSIKEDKVFVVLRDGNVREKPTIQSRIVGKIRQYDIIMDFQLTTSKNWISFKAPPSNDIYEAISHAKKSTAYFYDLSLGDGYDDKIRTFFVFGMDSRNRIVEHVRGYFVKYTHAGIVTTNTPWLDEQNRRVSGLTQWYEILHVPFDEIVFEDRYIHTSLGRICPDLATARETIRTQTQKEHAEARRKRMEKMNLPENIENAVAEHKIILGMTKEQVIMAWGEPDDTNRTVNAQGTREQWIYGDWSRSKPTFLYFNNGILTGWQD